MTAPAPEASGPIEKDIQDSTPAPFSVRGKTAIVTGAGSGINFAFAKLLLSKQCNVVIADLALRPEAQELVDQHTEKSESSEARAVFVKTDVTIWDDLERMFQVADEKFGGAEIICPGAGVYEPHWSNLWHPPGSSSSVDPAHGTPDTGLGHYATLDINITHPIRTTQLAISRFLHPRSPARYPPASASSPKRIVHISSIAGQLTFITTPLYFASKHAISGFVRSLALLDGQCGIRVNAVAPGMIWTPLWSEHPEKLKYAKQGTDVWVSPEEVAEAMLACVEDESIGGGVVVEVTKGKRRRVEGLNDPGPPADAGADSIEEGVKDVFGWLGQGGWGVNENEQLAS